jgi:hypothetical protein
MSLLYDHKTNTNDCHVLLDDNNSVDDVSHSILLRIPLLIFTSCLTNSIIKFILKSIIEIICSIPIKTKQQEEGGCFNCKWRPSLQSITEEEEEEEEEDEEDHIFSQEPEKEKEEKEKEVSLQLMKATSQKENDMLTAAAAAAVFSFSSSSSSSNNKALSSLSSSSSIAVPIHTILSNRFTLLMLHSRTLLRFNQAFLLLNCCSKFEISTFDIELN